MTERTDIQENKRHGDSPGLQKTDYIRSGSAMPRMFIA